MLGTPQHQQQAGEVADKLASGEYQPYLDHILSLFGSCVQGKQNLFNTGLQGEQHLADTGFTGSSDLATSLAQALMSQSKLQYAGQANQNQMKGGLIGNILSFLSGGGGEGGGTGGGAGIPAYLTAG
jgi:phage-related minor tail protein